MSNMSDFEQWALNNGYCYRDLVKTQEGKYSQPIAIHGYKAFCGAKQSMHGEAVGAVIKASGIYVGSLKPGLVDGTKLYTHAPDSAARIAELEARKDAAYFERNQCVALIARMALALGHDVAVTKTAIDGWSEDWHGCIYIELPTGQVSWNFHDSQAYLFEGLPSVPAVWDGHDTPEKYRRVNDAFIGIHQNAAIRQIDASLNIKGGAE